MITNMTKYFDQKLSQDALETYQGYSLQVFTSGRFKLSFHITHAQRVEYYGECPKRYRTAYENQHSRSHQNMAEHFEIVADVLAASPHSLVHRVHLKGDNNATADNAHIVTDTDASTCHVILSSLHHQWHLPDEVIQALLSASGPRKGAASCFNEYMPSYEHDWQDIEFEMTDWHKGYRSPCKAQANNGFHAVPHHDDDMF
jgi:hypothetical protein